ncbi:hypothetical protein GYMLUDRAFT_266256 [Collybiopsis luxurians FD-317 M1]|uniref:Uncharacterized protein n=1 Tax=Collybiopsis luxurians FD-317 M1 TaxID=944289 RepID=A0A0D0BX31_9AGAR|nr:hypothetical protein GYMLUDRAFT_266256 [Collybiopsis luxurians FD-317 M1]
MPVIPSNNRKNEELDDMSDTVIIVHEGRGFGVDDKPAGILIVVAAWKTTLSEWIKSPGRRGQLPVTNRENGIEPSGPAAAHPTRPRLRLDTDDREESSICTDTAEGYQPSFSLSSTRRPPTRLYTYLVPGGDGLTPQAYSAFEGAYHTPSSGLTPGAWLLLDHKGAVLPDLDAHLQYLRHLRRALRHPQLFRRMLPNIVIMTATVETPPSKEDATEVMG